MKHLFKYIRIRTGTTVSQAIGGLLIGGFIALGLYLLASTIRPMPSAGEVADRAIKAKMRYHGTETAFQDYKGRWYFVRNGRRCNLGD
jgi:hypothetical protein